MEREREVIFQELFKFLSKGGGKLGAMVRDDLVIEAKNECILCEKMRAATPFMIYHNQ